MKEIVIISGKGGTGKTSLTAAFSFINKNKKLVVADCDVDASDLHILLKPVKTVQELFYSGHEAVIDNQKCTSCGLCADNCRFDAVKITESQYHIDPVLCEGCKVCVTFCPARAIEFPEQHCGYWYDSETSIGQMIHAKLNPGAENSGKLVSVVRQHAKKIAENISADWLLVDGPPGIGCAVIASITGSDAVIIVTEPTKSGLHDLKRVLKLSTHFGMKAFIIINKADLNPLLHLEIEQTASTCKSVILGYLPYSTEIQTALNQGKTITEYKPDSHFVSLLESIWNKFQIHIN